MLLLSALSLGAKRTEGQGRKQSTQQVRKINYRSAEAIVKKHNKQVGVRGNFRAIGALKGVLTDAEYRDVIVVVGHAVDPTIGEEPTTFHLVDAETGAISYNPAIDATLIALAKQKAKIGKDKASAEEATPKPSILARLNPDGTLVEKKPHIPDFAGRPGTNKRKLKFEVRPNEFRWFSLEDLLDVDNPPLQALPLVL